MQNWQSYGKKWWAHPAHLFASAQSEPLYGMGANFNSFLIHLERISMNGCDSLNGTTHLSGLEWINERKICTHAIKWLALSACKEMSRVCSPFFAITLSILHEISHFLCLNISEKCEEFIWRIFSSLKATHIVRQKKPL